MRSPYARISPKVESEQQRLKHLGVRRPREDEFEMIARPRPCGRHGAAPAAQKRRFEAGERAALPLRRPRDAAPARKARLMRDARRFPARVGEREPIPLALGVEGSLLDIEAHGINALGKRQKERRKPLVLADELDAPVLIGAARRKQRKQRRLLAAGVFGGVANSSRLTSEVKFAIMSVYAAPPAHGRQAADVLNASVYSPEGGRKASSRRCCRSAKAARPRGLLAPPQEKYPRCVPGVRVRIDDELHARRRGLCKLLVGKVPFLPLISRYVP